MKYKTQWGETFEVEVLRTRYMTNENLAVVLMFDTGEPFTTLSVNLDDALEPNQAYVDTNNNPTAEAFIKENGLGKLTGSYGFSGFCAYPLYEFNIDKIKELK